MKNIKLFEEFVNEAIKFIDFKFNSNKNHNPVADIVEGHIDSDTFITYGVYIKDTSTKKQGDEFMEYYTGANYKAGSSKKSSSRIYSSDKIPSKYKAAWDTLKAKYKSKYK
jgi:hypothetical protein